MDEKIQIRAHGSPWYSGIDFLIKTRTITSGKIAYVEPIIFKARELDGSVVQPTISMSNDAAQVLMDDLWSAGIRPTEGSGSAGAMRAVERHLNDMRMIVASKLEIKL